MRREAVPPLVVIDGILIPVVANEVRPDGFESAGDRLIERFERALGRTLLPRASDEVCTSCLSMDVERQQIRAVLMSIIDEIERLLGIPEIARCAQLLLLIITRVDEVLAPLRAGFGPPAIVVVNDTTRHDKGILEGVEDLVSGERLSAGALEKDEHRDAVARSFVGYGERSWGIDEIDVQPAVAAVTRFGEIGDRKVTGHEPGQLWPDRRIDLSSEAGGIARIVRNGEPIPDSHQTVGAVDRTPVIAEELTRRWRAQGRHWSV